MEPKQTDVSTWLEGFERLRNYAKRSGHTLVPRKYVTPDGYHLGAWVGNQRNVYKQGHLSLARQKALEGITDWVWSVNEAKCIKGFKCLCQYVEREGDAIVPRRYIQKNGYKLGLWVMTQRQQYRQKQLTKKRQKALEQLPGWVWNARKTMSKGWLRSLERLCEYVKCEGHARVPGEYETEDGYKLGAWVINQRHKYKKGRLSTEQQEALEQLPGWAWSARKGSGNYISEAWLKSLVWLGEYVEREGHARVRQHYKTEDGYCLGTWVSTQRSAYRRGALSAGRQEALEQLPGWVWNARKGQDRGMSKRWLKSLERLRQYVEREGNALASYSYVTEDGYKLGTWVRDQRYEHKKGRLSREQAEGLEHLPGWVWSARDAKDRPDGLQDKVRLAEEEMRRSKIRKAAQKSQGEVDMRRGGK